MRDFIVATLSLAALFGTLALAVVWIAIDLEEPDPPDDD